MDKTVKWLNILKYLFMSLFSIIRYVQTSDVAWIAVAWIALVGLDLIGISVLNNG